MYNSNQLEAAQEAQAAQAAAAQQQIESPVDRLRGLMMDVDEETRVEDDRSLQLSPRRLTLQPRLMTPDDMPRPESPPPGMFGNSEVRPFTMTSNHSI